MSPAFAYSARDADGTSIRGVLDAPGRDAALDALRVRSLIVTGIHPKKSLRGLAALAALGASSCANERIVFFRTTAVLSAAGVPLLRSLEASRRECAHPGFREAIGSILGDMECGSSMHAAMERRPREFDAASCALARAGEASGTLDLALGRIAALLERRRALHKRIGAGLAYPAVVTVVAIALVGFLTASVVPTIGALLRSSGASLPWFTNVLLFVGARIVNPWAWAACALVAVPSLASIVAALRVERIRAACERALLHVPVVGPALKKADTASCARTLSALLHTGVGIAPALALVREVSQSALHRRALESVALCVSSGRPLSAGFADEAWYAPTFVALARAGEAAGALDDLLARAAEYQEAEVDAAVAALSAVVEPVLVVVLGTVVGAIVAAILIPLYSAIGRIQ